MKLKSSFLRRTAIVLAGAVVGLGGAAAIAAPASAHTASVTGKATCNTATGNYDITWTVTNDWGQDATLHDVRISPANPAPAEADDSSKVLQEGTTIPLAAHGVTSVDFRQSVPGTSTSASVSFTAWWDQGKPDQFTDPDNSAKVDLGGPCAPPAERCVSPDKAHFHHTMTVEGDHADATVTLDQGIKLCKGEPVTLVSYFAPKPKFSVPQYKFDSDSDTITTDHPVATLHVQVPDCNTQVDLFFGSEQDIISPITDLKHAYLGKILGSKYGKGSRSEGKFGTYNGGTKACQQPAVQPVSHCDGALTLNLSNTGDNAAYPIDFTVKSANGFTKTVTVEADKAATVDVPAGAGDVVVSAEGFSDQTIKWEEPGDCALPSVSLTNTCDTVTVTVANPEDVLPADAKITYGDESKTLTVAAGEKKSVTFKPGSATYATVAFTNLDTDAIKATLKKLTCGGSGGGGGTPGLPVTGAAAGSIAGGAAALLALGGVLFFMARRRRIKFTA